MAKANSFETMPGLAKHPWIDRPDTKFNADGLYKVDLVCDLANEKVQAFKAKIDAAAQAYFDEVTKDLGVVQKKKHSIYVPYKMEEDATTGEETGRIIFMFRRNAKVTIRATGEVKELSVAIYDSKGNALPRAIPIYGGATLRIVGGFRDIKVASTGKIGVRMDFFAVKVLKMPSRDQDPFKAEESDEDGWTWEGEGDTSASTDNPTTAPIAADADF